jgi:hypothetical protein
MVTGSFEALQARNVWDERLCSKAGTKDNEPATELLARTRLECPGVLLFVEGHPVTRVLNCVSFLMFHFLSTKSK